MITRAEPAIDRVRGCRRRSVMVIANRIVRFRKRRRADTRPTAGMSAIARMTGVEVLDILSMREPPISILRSGVDDVVEAVCADRVLIKPLRTAEIVAAIERIKARRSRTQTAVGAPQKRRRDPASQQCIAGRRNPERPMPPTTGGKSCSMFCKLSHAMPRTVRHRSPREPRRRWVQSGFFSSMTSRRFATSLHRGSRSRAFRRSARCSPCLARRACSQVLDARESQAAFTRSQRHRRRTLTCITS